MGQHDYPPSAQTSGNERATTVSLLFLGIIKTDTPDSKLKAAFMNETV